MKPTCQHDVRLQASGEAFFDTNIIMMAARFTCSKCGRSFRALGVDDDVTTEAPGAAGDTIVFPLVPIGEEPHTEFVGRC